MGATPQRQHDNEASNISSGINTSHLAIIIGATLLLVVLVLVFRVTKLNDQQWFVVRTLLALGAGGISAALPGALNIILPSSVRASGALAVMALVFYFNPRPLLGGDGAISTLNATLTSQSDR